MRILITGATGFIGGRLLQSLLQAPLSQDQKLIALRRSPPPKAEAGDSTLTWRTCNLFSLRQTEDATRDCDIAVYLVHSMLPAARLNQASFEDTDLILADNFARSCHKNGIKRIIYLGGLIPDAPQLSAHLRSRLEVESALAAYGEEVITLRAGLILGAEGSSFQILSQLVRNLPMLGCPKWTRNITQPIAVPDALQLLRHAIRDRALPAGPYDIGGPDVLSYQALMQETGKALGLHRRFVEIPLFSPGLSLLWIQLITGASRNLITPLIQSLKYEMTVRNRKLMELSGVSGMPLADSLREALRELAPSLRASTRKRTQFLRQKREMRSIQRLPLPPGKNADWVTHEYFRWLPRRLAPLVRVHSESRSGLPLTWHFRLTGIPRSLLELRESPDRSTPDRTVLLISGGLLVARDSNSNARLEFREVLGGTQVLAAIHDFKPSLPWPIYKFTQALAHLWVMARFRSHLSSSGSRLSLAANP